MSVLGLLLLSHRKFNCWQLRVALFLFFRRLDKKKKTSQTFDLWLRRPAAAIMLGKLKVEQELLNHAPLLARRYEGECGRLGADCPLMKNENTGDGNMGSADHRSGSES